MAKDHDVISFVQDLQQKAHYKDLTWQGTFQQYLEGHAGTLSEVNQRALKIYQESKQANPTVETDLKTLIRSDFYGTGVIILSNPLL